MESGSLSSNMSLSDRELMDSQFLLTFDTNPIILNRVKETLRADPLVVRYVSSSLLLHLALGDGRKVELG
jgi:hypothetical protein